MTWEGKEQLLLLRKIANNSSTQIQITNEDLSQSSSSKSECVTSKNISQDSTVIHDKLDSTILEEMLIEEVKMRPPIYDYTLPLAARGRHKIAELWKEVSEALNGLMSPEEAKKRWKTLKDTFSKAVAEEKKPSGSSRISKKPWKHLELMSFLRSVSTYKNSISNVTMNEFNLCEDSTDNAIEEYKDQSCKNHNKGYNDKVNNDFNESMIRIADAFCKTETPVMSLPKLPELTAMDGIFIYVKEKLRNLSSEKQDKLLLKFLQDIIREERHECE